MMLTREEIWSIVCRPFLNPFCLSACTLFVSAQLVNRLLRTPQNNLYVFCVCVCVFCFFFIIGVFLFFVVVIVQTMHHENIPI